MILISIVLVLAVLGFVLWLITTYVPMPEPFKKAIVVFAILAVIVWLLRIAFTTGGLVALP